MRLFNVIKRTPSADQVFFSEPRLNNEGLMWLKGMTDEQRSMPEFDAVEIQVPNCNGVQTVVNLNAKHAEHFLCTLLLYQSIIQA